MKILGIIPAAGKAERFGGLVKELLPIDEGITLLDNCIDSMNYAGADKIIIVTSPAKISLHKYYVESKHKNLNIEFFVQNVPTGLGDLIELVTPQFKELNLFAMPDTLFPLDSFCNNLAKVNILSAGLFKTLTPNRFGIMVDDINGPVFVDKPLDFPTGIYKAWGTLIFTGFVRPASTFTEFINTNIDSTFNLDYYVDFASWKDYSQYIYETTDLN